MEFQGFPKIPRYSRECVITEKIDGTNGQIFIEQVQDAREYIAIQEGEIALYAGSRTRWLEEEKDNFGFWKWVKENKSELVKLGPGRHFGEWWGQGIQRGYGLKEKRFSLFNVKKWSDPLVRPACCHVVPVIRTGMFSSEIVDRALEGLQLHGSLAAPGFMNPEGIIIFHTAGSLLFKKTLINDEKGKGE
jgi:hypothetical protein